MQAKLRILMLIVKMQELRIQTDKMIYFKVFSKANNSHHASVRVFSGELASPRMRVWRTLNTRVKGLV